MHHIGNMEWFFSFNEKGNIKPVCSKWVLNYKSIFLLGFLIFESNRWKQTSCELLSQNLILSFYWQLVILGNVRLLINMPRKKLTIMKRFPKLCIWANEISKDLLNYKLQKLQAINYPSNVNLSLRLTANSSYQNTNGVSLTIKEVAYIPATV